MQKLSSSLEKINNVSHLSILYNGKKNENKFLDPNYDLDFYTYEEALLYDKRSFWRIYYICLLSKERIFNAFFFKSNIKIKSIRISMFLFNNGCDFALNAFFYTTEKISDKYHYNGNNLLWFTLLNNILITISSSLFSIIIVLSFNFLTDLKKKAIKHLFKEKVLIYKIMIEKLQKIYKILKIKIIVYIFLEFLILLFFFYYINGFCIVFKKTQIDWLLDSIISIFISIIVKLLISFIITKFYLVSLKYKYKRLYNIVMLLY